MKKKILIFTVICIAYLLVSCSAPVNKADSSEKTGTSDSPATAAIMEVSGASGQSAIITSESPVDSGMTLAGIKQAAQSAGFDVEDVQDYQLPDNPIPVGGFNIIYIDDSSESHIPIYEFKNAQDALTYAALVNEAGYNLCIINGRFLTMVSAKYGIPLNDNEKNTLEPLLKSTVMAYVAPSAAPLTPVKDYAGACIQIEIIREAFDTLVNKSVLLYDKSVAEDARIEAAYITFTLISSGDLAFTSSLSEDQIQIDAVKQVWEMFGVADMKIVHETANDYVLTGKRAGLDTSFELHCMFDPATGSLRLTDIDGGQAIEFFEYVPLGGDKYAFQTLYERAIIVYKGGKITSFVYSLNKRNNEYAYNADADGIYGKSAGIDEAWVSQAGEDSFDQFISYDGTTLKIAADSFLGTRLKTDIQVQ